MHPIPTAMSRALFDNLALTLRPWHAPLYIPHPLTSPIICMDVAAHNNHFYVGLYSPFFGSRIICAPPFISSQQQAELFAADAATRLAVRLGYSQITLIGDNSSVLYALERSKAILSIHPWTQTLRRICNRLIWCGLTVHLVWTPSHNQPADPISRADPSDPASLASLASDALCRWQYLLHDPSSLHIMGFLHQ
jgi:hypothetical protein